MDGLDALDGVDVATGVATKSPALFTRRNAGSGADFAAEKGREQRIVESPRFARPRLEHD